MNRHSRWSSFLLGSVLGAAAISSTAAAADKPAAAKQSVAPRRPEVPAAAPGSGLTNPVDLILQPYFATSRITLPQAVDDRTFARRVWLDTIGLLPTPEQLAEFVTDTAPDKRTALVRKLLANKRAYAEHWLTFWNDALRNDYRGTGYIDGGRKQITGWLYAALENNMPFDQFVRELISPNSESEGFIKGIVWRGVVNASQVPPVQAAQNVSQVFLGINLKCASCHDSFINDWKLADAYGLASVFAEGPLEMHHCDQPIGEFAPMKFLFPELGELDAAQPRAERLRRLADVITSRENGRLTRTMVNRLWARLLGRGLVMPVDEMDKEPWNRDLLDWLAADLADQKFDLKQTLERILTSRAYQMPPVGISEDHKAEFVFRGPAVRRLSAEQFVDAVASLTGPAYAAAVAPVNPPTKLDARWIWNDANAAQATAGGRIFLRKTFELPAVPTQAVAVVSADNQLTLFVNGKRLGESREWQKPLRVDLREHLKQGKNVIAVEAINWPDAATKSGLEFSSPNAAGLIFASRIRIGQADSAVEQVFDLGSNATWTWSAELKEGWELPEFNAEAWKPAADLADANGGPWKLSGALQAALAAPAASGVFIRASLANADPLQMALGRSNREQVVTDRPAAATTLQALELTNGETLDRLLKQGGQRCLAEAAGDGSKLIQRVYAQALGRSPSAAESALAAELIGTPPTQAGVEDLLWAIIMLPEFQLIY